MSNDNNAIISKDMIDILEVAKENKSKEIQEAVKSLDLTSEIMNAMMSGKQIDLAYYQLFIARKKKVKNE